MSENLNLHTQTIQHNIFAVEWSGPPYDGHTTVTFQYSLIGDDKNGGRGKNNLKTTLDQEQSKTMSMKPLFQPLNRLHIFKSYTPIAKYYLKPPNNGLGCKNALYICIF